MRAGASVVVLIVLAGAMPARKAAGQSLGEVAQQEKKKREGKPEAPATPKKVFTGEDLEGMAATREPEGKPARGADPDPPDPSGTPGSPAVAPSLEKLGPDESQVRAAQETAWRTRKKATDAARKAAEQQAESAQRDRDALGPVPPPTQDPLSWSRAVAAADARLAGAKAAQKLAKDALDQLEEDGRRAGIPPGWLR